MVAVPIFRHQYVLHTAFRFLYHIGLTLRYTQGFSLCLFYPFYLFMILLVIHQENQLFLIFRFYHSKIPPHTKYTPSFYYMITYLLSPVNIFIKYFSNKKSNQIWLLRIVLLKFKCLAKLEVVSLVFASYPKYLLIELLMYLLCQYKHHLQQLAYSINYATVQIN